MAPLSIDKTGPHLEQASDGRVVSRPQRRDDRHAQIHLDTIPVSDRRLVDGARTWLQNPLIGVSTALVAIGFVATKWSDSWGQLRDLAAGAQWVGLVASLALYVLALLAVAAGISMSLDRSVWVFWGALGGQLLKYIPGAIWQGIPTAAERSIGGYLTYAVVTLGAAGVGLLLSRQTLIVGFGVALCAALFFLGAKYRSVSTAAQVGLVIVTAVLLLAASGAAIGMTYGLDPFTWGRDMAAAWSLGVLSIPIPAGLGIRELALTGLSDADVASVALVATSHRAVTLFGDVAAGAIGLIAYSRMRRD